jgi:UPF0716 protein FxsA
MQRPTHPAAAPRRSLARIALAVIVLALPAAEIVVLVLVGEAVGVAATLALLLVAALSGVLVIRHRGAAAWRRLREAASRGELPVAAAFDGICIFLAGLLLIVPGFITDGVALLLLVPPLRHAVRALLAVFLADRVQAEVYQRTQTIEGEYHEVHGTIEPRPAIDRDRPPPSDRS